MKQILIGKELSGYILDLVKKNNWNIILGDVIEYRNLLLLCKSKPLNDEGFLIKFDTSQMKLTKPYVDLIKSTKHNVVIVTDELKKVPKELRKVCEVKRFELEEKKGVMDIMDKLGKENISLEEIKKYPLGQLIKYLNVNWQKFEQRNKVYDLLVEINKRLWRVGDDWLYLYLMWGFPKQNRKTWFKYPVVYKYSRKESICKKIADYYNQSVREVSQSWWLIRRLMDTEMADRYGLNDDERKLLGIKKKRVVKKKKIIGSKNLLEM